MDWTMIGAIGEITGAAAVVASLLYVARQVKHATSVAAVEGFEAHAKKTADFAMATSFAPDYRAWVEQRFSLGPATLEEGRA